jgi:hypothetical protein
MDSSYDSGLCASDVPPLVGESVWLLRVTRAE